ncbi:MAG: ABC transporter permease [Eubacteriales bacterium]|nr:ABC transporter permease [Eubacteriales bacterium]
MNKHLSLMRYEARTLIRDPFQVLMLLFPFLMLGLSTLAFPAIIRSISEGNEAAARITMLLLLIMIMSFGTLITGAMGSFMLLEQKDEKTINTIAVTPVGISGYLVFKLIYLYLLAAVSIMLVMFGTGYFAGETYSVGGISLFDNIEDWQLIVYSFVAALFAPTLALLQASLAKNKVEGFALIKGTGIVALLPMLIILDSFKGGLQYVLGIFPNFWSTKALFNAFMRTNTPSDLDFIWYMVIGAAYSLVILVFSYRVFLKKIQY